MTYLLKLLLGFIGLYILVKVGCTSRDRNVQFVLPEGFSGPIAIVEDVDGAEPLRSTHLFSDTYTLHIPESGILRVSYLRMFRGWHTIVAVTSDGREIPYDYGIDVLPDGAANPQAVEPSSIAVRGCGKIEMGGRSVLCFFVGAEDSASTFDCESFVAELPGM